MKLLAEPHYYKVIEPLKKVEINHFFARAVVERGIGGRIYVDCTDEPRTFYIAHPYGMGLLFGESHHSAFNESFKEYAFHHANENTLYEWVQAFPNTWDNVLAYLFGHRLVKYTNKQETDTNAIELHTRVNFRFNQEKYLARKKQDLPTQTTIIQTNGDIFRTMKGSVIPYYFWKDEADFLTNGIGFSLLHQNTHASTAYAAFIQGDSLEIGIETAEEYQGKGFAEQVCSALIDYCIENRLMPVWACRLGNTGSYKLAQKLGFEPSLEIPYYRFCKL